MSAAAGTEAEFALVWEGVPLVRVEGGPPVPEGAAQGGTPREPTPLESLLAQHHQRTKRWPTASEVQRFGERIGGLAVR